MSKQREKSAIDNVNDGGSKERLDGGALATSSGNQQEGVSDTDKAAVDENYLFETLIELCRNNIKYFENDDSESGPRIHGAFVGIIDHVETAKPLVKEVSSFVHEYDFSKDVPGNGFRSFLYVMECCLKTTLKLARYVMENRGTMLFRKSLYAKEVEAYNHLMASLCTCLKHCHTLRQWTKPGQLFPDSRTVEELLGKADTINQFCFYGRCLGFQFCESMKPLLKFISIGMAGFSEGYYSEGGKISKATSLMYTSTKYMIDPELRARRIVNISQNSNIDFCKSFWFLAESQLMHSLPSFVGFKVKVSRVITIPPEPIQLKAEKSNTMINIPVPQSHGGPGPIKARLISAVKRKGMIGDRVNPRSTIHPPSSGLLFHCHGGGFVAQSSKSHESYLREWAISLNVPILSIDYSLAPEAPFPRALEEVFYAYCWALKNCELLGTTAEKVIFAGDSAGANLNLGCAMKCIETGVRRPDGIFLAYCPVLISFVPSPARMLCLMDPLLPFGFMMRCLKAYACPSKEVLEMNRKRYEERQSIVNAGLVQSTVDTNGNKKEDDDGSNQSDSPENSAWDQQNSMNTVPLTNQHLSPISDTVSDTLALKSQTVGNTIDLMSPDEDTITSLEEDSQPITLHQINLKTEQSQVTVVDDLDMDLPSDMSSEQITNKHVSEFIERYVLDTTTNAEGELEPILRPVSSASEDNVVLDIGRETLSVQNLQEKVSNVASNLVNRVSSTFSAITTSKPISSSGSQSEFQSNLEALIARSPSDECIFDVPKDSHLSPYWATDAVLSQFPPTKILTVVLDPCLDDCVMFAKRLKNLNNPVTLDILPGLPHGFLNFASISKEAHEGSKLCVRRIAEMFELQLPADEGDQAEKKCC
ncbi:hormone-sensitive lipase [Uranotaenia lowii]|uniref:hormone-sensitive lipase n=1 Tax=Uranotaenia lowii TaxID=190385 RepID=UPI00247AC263|nr:hormone-sensitive lipase [Uranotaenia lowii]XP_055606264.1 hormone-sensitive lipase [Uranotaenia lowii]XP_055606265.1 hormone-sensitive lipase [Uranotaenia lowii]